MSGNGSSAKQIIRGDRHDPQAPPGSAATFLCLGPGWSTTVNTPFRLHKSWGHKGGISSPLIVHRPAGMRQRGALRHVPVHFIDLLPTLLELAGAQPEATWNGHRPPPLPGRRIVAAGSNSSWALYDLWRDHADNRNLAARYPERLQNMAQLWQERDTEYRHQAASEDWPPAAAR